MDMEEIQELINRLEKSHLKKIIYKKDGFELHLEKEDGALPLVPQERARGSGIHHEMPKIPSSPREFLGTFVKSPMVGTFYSAASPEEAPFVKVGDSVDEKTIVCIIEAMKVMNEVKAGVSGIVAEIIHKNSEPVEFGSRLFRIEQLGK